jgi:DNA-3-methyladenine glycosylase
VNNKLKKDFYNRNVRQVAQDLLGKIFVVNDKKSGQELRAKIVEVEAYDGRFDKAAHSFGGITERNKIMFEEGGYLYIYFIYGIHFCANVVTGPKGVGAAILLRAMESVEGEKFFAFRRFGKRELNKKEYINLLNGPAKICQGFGLNKKQNGTSLCGNEIYLIDQPDVKKEDIVRTKRIGITKSKHLPWRYFINNNPYVSNLGKKNS